MKARRLLRQSIGGRHFGPGGILWGITRFNISLTRDSIHPNSNRPGVEKRRNATSASSRRNVFGEASTISPSCIPLPIFIQPRTSFRIRRPNLVSVLAGVNILRTTSLASSRKNAGETSTMSPSCIPLPTFIQPRTSFRIRRPNLVSVLAGVNILRTRAAIPTESHR
jgi:hypothetical protein